MWEIDQVQVELLFSYYYSKHMNVIIVVTWDMSYSADTNEPYQVLCEPWSHRLSVFPH